MAGKSNTNVKKKTNTGSKPKAGSKAKSTRKEESFFDNKVAREIFILISLALCIVFFIGNLGFGGIVGRAVTGFFFGIFGLISYTLPILTFIAIIFCISNHNNSVARIKVIFAFLVMLFLCVFIQLVTDNKVENYNYTDYYMLGYNEKKGGGFFGGSICKLFVTWFGTVGAFIVDIVLIIIGIVIITGRSFIGGVSKGGKKVYDTAKNDMEQYREDVREKRKVREEKKLMRTQKVERGVTLDTKIEDRKKNKHEEVQMADEYEAEGLHEIKPPREIDENDPLFNFTRSVRTQDDELAHYEDEQSSGLESYTGEEEDIPEIEENAENLSDTGNISNLLDMDLINEEMEKDEQNRKEKQKENQHSDIAPAPIEEEKKGPKKTVKYSFPPLTLLRKSFGKKTGVSREELDETSRKLQQTLATFGVNIKVTDVSCGPTVTRYEILPETGVKVSKIVSLADDIKLNLAAADIRIEAPIPGKSAIGIEVPNRENAGVLLGDLLSTSEFKSHKSKVAFTAGKDISGQMIIADIDKMPHVIIAGATGSGKSVCINTIIMSILYHAKPSEVKLIMVDPKVVELSVYNGIPHLLTPVVTDPKKAAGALAWAVTEMTRRYNLFAQYSVRDIRGFNDMVEHMDVNPEFDNIPEEEKPEKLPSIVIIIDELADLMMTASKDVEDSIVRLAQLARAAGMHLVIATQRPDANVITGLIKANVPSKIAFAVSNPINSRVILDMNGAEKLLGKGDMLYYPAGLPKPVRVQGAFVSDEEVTETVKYIKEHNKNYIDDMALKAAQNPGGTDNPVEAIASGTITNDDSDGNDELFAAAGRSIIELQRASIGNLQRKFKIGFNRAARIMDQLCEAGVVGPEVGTKPREVIMTMEDFNEKFGNK